MTPSNPIIAQFQGEPALISEDSSPWLESCATQLAEEMASERFQELSAKSDGFWFAEDDWRSAYRPYNVENGILSVPINGILLNQFGYARPYATGYEYILEAVKRGVDDANVKGIALIMNSNGGVIAGNFDLADRIYAFRGQKTIKAFVAEAAYSAAYSLASAASDITMTRTSGVGSIGVVVVHQEMSKMLENIGVSVNIIRSKPRKIEGNPYEPLSDRAKKRLQERVDAFHKDFVAIVARNRAMSTDAVDATDALTFMASEALNNGLADKISPLDDALMTFQVELSSNEGVNIMADQEVKTIPIAEHEAAIATATDTAKTEGVATGVAQERARLSAVLESDEGKARPVAALNAVMKTGMSSDEAIAFLGALPVETKEEAQKQPVQQPTAGAPAGMLNASMDGTANPEVGANPSDDETPQDVEAKDRALARNFGLAGFARSNTQQVN